MTKRFLFAGKQLLKMFLQNIILPCVYQFWHFIYRNKSKNLIIFADAHHESVPFSMEALHKAVKSRGFCIKDEIYDYAHMSYIKSAVLALKFMKLYAQAKYVFVCDNFLPVSACKKDPETVVVQLLHSSGLFKKMGYDTTEDIPKGYLGNVYTNYNLVTVSSPSCVDVIGNSMRQPMGVVQALGTCRTDCYFDQSWIEKCRVSFFQRHPEALGKKIILWAPTFRGNAADPYQVGMESIAVLEKNLGNDYFFLKKVHPHIDSKYHLSNTTIPTECLLPVADLMITDYSSVVIDFLFFEKPYVLFAPDLEEFQIKRGFYIEYDSLTPFIVTKEQELKNIVLAALNSDMSLWIKKNRQYHLSSCDGKVTERLLTYLKL